MLESIYRHAGLRVGLFTSPHLVSFAERIQVDRRLISREDVARLTEEIRAAMATLGAETHPTFFEVVTVMALKYFAEEKCDLVVWETGLGGRLDATNIVTPLASVITNVQLDHQQWLGQTLPEIAREKAGIIKPGVPVLTATTDPAALAVIAETARQRQAPLTVVTESARDGKSPWPENTRSETPRWRWPSCGFSSRKFRSPRRPCARDSKPRAGMAVCRWSPRRMADHSAGRRAQSGRRADAAAAARRRCFPGRAPALILGTMADKDYGAICRTLAPLAAKIFLSPVASERGADPQWLADSCRKANAAAPVAVCRNIAQALAQAAHEPFVVVTGSIHFVGEAMEELGLASSDSERALNDYGAVQA